MIQIKKQQTGKKYWQSLDQLSGDPKFQAWIRDEFPASATEMLDGQSRRNVLKLMAASFGLAGLTACRRPVENILPNVKGAEDYVHGKPSYYATAMSLGGAATGLLVEVNDGRPTKIEGNPEHPFSLGAANSFQQASILGLYDPDRARTPRRDGKDVSWNDIDLYVKQQFDESKLGKGDGLRILSEGISSPTLLALKAQLLTKYPAAKWVEWDAIGDANAVEGSRLAFGQHVVPRYRFDRAEVVLSLDNDFLGLDSPTVLPAKEFSKRRRVAAEHDRMNRLYVVESQYSLTGGMADHRLRMRSSEIRNFAADLAAELNAGGNQLRVAGGDEKRTKFLKSVAKELGAMRGKCVVVAGPRQPAAVHAAAHAINQALGNVGETVVYLKPATEVTRPQVEALKELAGELAGGKVTTLVILGGNPAYTAPADLSLSDNIAKAAASIYLGPDQDETAKVAKALVPAAHFLESWGDVFAPDGTVTVQQPLIQPLYGGRTAIEVVAQLAGVKESKGYEVVRSSWLQKLGGELAWRKALHDGVAPNTAFAEVKPTVDSAKVQGALQGNPAAQGIELVFVPSASTWDGRYANNGWMQEAPDPMTKLTWDNVALVSPATARQLGVELGDLISIERAGMKIEAPVLVQPGQADNSISIALGYGRSECGRVGRGVGVNAYRLRTSDALGIATSVNVAKTGGKYPLAQTQEHHTLIEPITGKHRPIVREATIEHYRKEPKVFEEMVEVPEQFSLYGDWQYDKGYQWGMAIDLNSCTGCNACMVACQAENNIPVVGKDQVARGREMHWIRMDRYYVGDENDPQVVNQAVPCMQCENAPCENVCPVAATVHSPEGLNEMAYNRCVGTRYCSNNCPYKVRRFNFLNFNEGLTESEALGKNPDVSVRMRGIMEKCMYCVQRIQEARINAKVDGRRPIKDGEIVTACQQTCPSEAIVFGNINDPNSRVSQMKKQHRNYALLEEINTKPRTTYLGKLRNPNPELEAQHG